MALHKFAGFVPLSPASRRQRRGGGSPQMLRLGLWVVFFFAGLATVCCQGAPGGGGSGVVDGVAYVDGRRAVGTTDEDFICATLDWWPPEKCDYGTCSWGLASLLNLNLSSPILLNAVKAFSPLKLRLGGSLQDKVIYDVGYPRQPCHPFVKNNTEIFGFTQGCLTMPRWDELNNFFKKSGALIIFGLNALNGRVNMHDGSVGGAWDSTNAAAFIHYTVTKGYEIHGWELGNELSGSGVGTRVGADQYAIDVIKLKSIINNLYLDFPVKPLVIAPGGFFDAVWFKEFLDKTKPDSLDVISHHIYNLGPGVDEHLTDKILNPSYLDGESGTFNSLKGILKNAGTSTTAWVGEAGGAYNSGHNLVTNAFIFSFWYLDQLGMSATYDTKTYCRQSFIGGNYGLLNTTTYAPNPDYYSALLWHRLMGRNSLSTNFTGTSNIRSYTHCAKQSQGITLLLINLSNNITARISATTDPAVRKHLRHHRRGVLKRHFTWTPGSRKAVGFTREEYHLTAKDGNLHSQTMLLNGRILELDQSGNIPSLEPAIAYSSEPITVAPSSIVFAHIPYFFVPACL